MSYGSTEVTVYIEIVAGDECSRDVAVVFGLECTSRDDPGRMSGRPEDCYLPEGAEFDVLEVALINEDTGVYSSIDWIALELFVGNEEAERLFEKACEKATEEGGW